jgi:eukaryotic-like serine/threonine-protein kinase
MSSEVTIPGYRIQIQIGSGRTATVYLARDQKNRAVALKVPKPGIFDDPTLGKMFSNEVLMLKSLNHPQIIHFFSGVPFGDDAHLAIQYFKEGALEEPPKTLGESFRVIADIADALDFAHVKKVIHQDVKPSNVYLEDGRAYLADFGAASSEAHPGLLAGSPFYMAPEVFRGERSSSKSDVYSLGVMAFQLITGARPFTGETYEEVQNAHLVKFAPSVRSLLRDIDPEVAKVIDRSLAKEPSSRPSARDIYEVFNSFLVKVAHPTSQRIRNLDRNVFTPLAEVAAAVDAEPAKPGLGRAAMRTEPLPELKPYGKPEPKKGILNKLFKRKS